MGLGAILPSVSIIGGSLPQVGQLLTLTQLDVPEIHITKNKIHLKSTRMSSSSSSIWWKKIAKTHMFPFSGSGSGLPVLNHPPLSLQGSLIHGLHGGAPSLPRSPTNFTAIPKPDNHLLFKLGETIQRIQNPHILLRFHSNKILPSHHLLYRLLPPNIVHTSRGSRWPIKLTIHIHGGHMNGISYYFCCCCCCCCCSKYLIWFLHRRWIRNLCASRTEEKEEKGRKKKKKATVANLSNSVAPLCSIDSPQIFSFIFTTYPNLTLIFFFFFFF